MLKTVDNKILDIREVTLLSIDEAKSAKENVPGVLSSAGKDWWLRSHGDFDDHSVDVVINDGAYEDGFPVQSRSGVRPALRIENLESHDLQIGSKIEVGDHTWTVILDDMVLCDDIVADGPFNKYYKRGNDYESSDIKRFVNDWAIEQGLEFKSVMENSDVKKVLAKAEQMSDAETYQQTLEV